MKKFVITTTAQRDLAEFNSADAHRDEAVQITVLGVLDSPNFQWLELRMRGETTRIEAIRKNPAPDKKYRWEWPEGFRVIHDKRGQHVEREVERGCRGVGISTIEIAGMNPFQFSHTRMMRRKDFISFSFKVGRLTKVIAPQTE